MQRLIEHAAGRDARGRPANLEGHGDDDALVGRHAREVHMEQVLAQVVPLHLADEGFFFLAAGPEVDDADAAANEFFHLLQRQGHAQGCFFVAINDGGHQALATKPPCRLSAPARAGLGDQMYCFGHSCVSGSLRKGDRTLELVPRDKDLQRLSRSPVPFSYRLHTKNKKRTDRQTTAVQCTGSGLSKRYYFNPGRRLQGRRAKI